MRIARVLFARLPEPGLVKTRLAADLDGPSAFALYRWLLRAQKHAFEEKPEPGSSYTDYVYYAPAISRLGARAKFYPDLTGLRLRFKPQIAGDLGQRLAAAAAEVLRDHDLAMIWGADIPALPPGIFATASALSPQSVITLARDGGYAFLSVAKEKFSPDIFSHIRWSTAQAGKDQITALKRCGIKVLVRAKVADLDRIYDLPRILRELEAFGRTEVLQDLHQTIRNLNSLFSPGEE